MPAYSLTAKRAHVYGFERKQAPTYSVIQGETDSRQGQRPAPPPRRSQKTSSGSPWVANSSKYCSETEVMVCSSPGRYSWAEIEIFLNSCSHQLLRNRPWRAVPPTPDPRFYLHTSQPLWNSLMPREDSVPRPLIEPVGRLSFWAESHMCSLSTQKPGKPKRLQSSLQLIQKKKKQLLPFCPHKDLPFNFMYLFFVRSTRHAGF